MKTYSQADHFSGSFEERAAVILHGDDHVIRNIILFCCGVVLLLLSWAINDTIYECNEKLKAARTITSAFIRVKQVINVHDQNDGENQNLKSYEIYYFGMSEEGYRLLGKFFENVGFAILVAVIIAYVVERDQKKAHLKLLDFSMQELMANSFRAAYGWTMPPEFIDEIHTQIFLQRVIRNDFVSEFTIRDFTVEEKDALSKMVPGFNFANRIIVEVSIDGYIQNMCDSSSKFVPEFFVEKEDCEEFNRCICFKMNEKGSHIPIIDLHDENLSQYKVVVQNNNSQGNNDGYILNNWYKLPEMNLAPSKEYRVYSSFLLVRSRIYTKEVWNVLTLTRNLTVRIRSEIDGLKIYGKLLSDGSFHCTEYGRKIEYIATKPLLPNQGFTIWWHG